jgi:hypothetical protein
MKNALFILSILFIGTSFGQTTATWTGSSSTDWSTASNWSPASIPGASSAVVIGSATNQPLLASNTTIASLTLTSSSVLDLGTYTLTVSGATITTSAQINNGHIIGASFTTTSSTFGAKTTFIGSTIQVRNSTFNAKSILTQNGSTQTLNYGNTFNSPVELTNTATQAFIFGYTSADIFNDSLLATVKGTYELVLAHSSTGNMFNGYCNFIKDASANNRGVVIGKPSSSATFASAVKITSHAASTSTVDGVVFTNCTFDSTSSLSTDNNAFTRGTLLFSNCTLNISLNITLQEQARLELRGETIFNEACEFTAPILMLRGFTNNDVLSITKTGSSTDLSTGPITSNGEFTLRNVGAGYLSIGSSSTGNQFISNLTLENTGGGTLIISLSEADTYLTGDLTLRNTSGTLRAGTVGTTNKPTLSGNLHIRQLGGSCLFAGIKLDAGKQIYTDTLSSGTFYLSDVEQLGTQALSLIGTSTARITINSGSDFGGNFTATAPSIFFSNAIFRGDLALTKTGNSIDQCDGNLTIYGTSLFKNTSSGGTFQLCYPANSMTYHGDVTFENAGTGNLWMGYAGIHYAKADVIFAGSNSLTTSWCNKLVLNGTGTQAIKRSNTLTNGVLRLEINKASGEANLEMPFPVSLNLNLAKGILKTTDTTILSLNTSCTLTGGSDSSYVDGPLTKVGTAAFTFPVGGDGVYAPLGIDAVASATTFKAKYIAGDPNPSYSRSAKDTTIGFVNRCGYWNIDRTTGSQNAVPSLGWSNNPCYSTAPVDASIALWDGSLWKDKGNAAYSGTSTAGNVKSSSAITSYPAVLNLGGECNLQASLSANRDTLYQGYLATFTASPANQSNYKFYVNGVLKQEGVSNQFKSSSLVTNDTLKVKVTNLDSCIGQTNMILQLVENVTVSFTFDRDSLVSVFANDEIQVDSGYVFTINGNALSLLADTNKVVCSGGSIVTDSSSVSSQLNRIKDLFQFCEDVGGFVLGESDTLLSLTPGFYRIKDTDSLPTTIELINSNEQYILYKEKNLNWSEIHQIYYSNGQSNNELFLIAQDTIFINGSLPLNTYLFAKTIVLGNTNSVRVKLYAIDKILVKNNVVLFASEIVQSCPLISNSACDLLINGDFSLIKDTYPLQENSFMDLDFNSLYFNTGAAQKINRPFKNNMVCNWGQTLPDNNHFVQLDPLLVTSTTNNRALIGIESGIQTTQAFQPFISSNSWVKISFKYKKPISYFGWLQNQPTNPWTVGNSSAHGRIFPILSEIPITFQNNNYLASNGLTYKYMPLQSVINVGDAVVVDDLRLQGIGNSDYEYFETYVQAPTASSMKYLSIVNTHANSSTSDNAAVVIDDIKVETCCVSPFTILSTNESNNYIKCSEILNYVNNHPWNSYLQEIFSQSPGGSLVLDVTNSSVSSPPEVIFGKALWVDIDFEINNSTLIMLDGLNVTVLSGKKLTLNNSTIKGCQVKWGAIYAQINSEVVVSNNSTIEDAQTAIYAYGSSFSYINAGSINFTNSKILDCNQGIIIQGSPSSSGNYPLTFHSSEISTSAGGHLHNTRSQYDQNLVMPGSSLPPSRGRLGLGFYYSGALISIGTGYGSLSQNKISKLEQGIRVLSANFNSVNLHIEDIYSASSSYSNNSFVNLQTSAAIVLDAVPGLPSRTVNLSSSIGQVLGGNSIENCANGVIGKAGGYSSVSVRFSTINQVNEAISFSKYIKCIFTIDVNNITYASRYGVRFDSNSKCKLIIKNNEISNTNGSANANAGGVGLQILHPLSNSNTSALVTNNIIKNYLVGIYASNLNGGSFTQYYPPEGQNMSMSNYFADNEVTVKPYLYNPFYDFTTGYYFNNCGRTNIYHNEQKTFSSSIVNNSAGFYYSGCSRANIICNSSEYVTYSNLFTLGDQHLTFAGNLMKNGNYGVYLLGSTIGKQGFDNDYSKLSNLNSWYPFDNPISGGFSSHLYVESTDGTNSEFFLKCITCSTGVGEATSPYPFLSNSISSLFPIIPFSNQTHIYSLFRMDNSTCWEHGLSDGPLTISTPDEGAGDSPFMKRYKAIQVADTSNSNDAQRIYDATFELYSDLMYDEGYLENDTLEDFVDSLETENIGKFYLIDQELSNKIAADTTLDLSKETSKLDDRITNIENMQAISDSITTSGVFEQAHHQVLNLLLAEELKNLAN